ncbi:MAG: class I SAM-dependent RNA methyltransferase [Clostridiaceae bacterium]|nr:class I SAM-dependent RNA methyltransferase [Clostridiaceae bacterium]
MPALFGIESFVSEELQTLGYSKSQIKVSDAEVCLTLKDQSEMPRAIARLNYNLRTAERVLLGLAEFSAITFDELFDQIRVLPWHQWLDQEYFIEITGYSRNSKLHSVPTCQSVIKKAIIEKLNSVHNYSKDIVPENKKKGIHRIQFSLINDKVNLRLDTSGEPLHKRGYRKKATEAPLRETLAAAILMISFYQRNIANQEILFDPLCGSGTFLIEAALIATRTAPGIQRYFSGAKKKLIGRKAFQIERKLALEKSLIYGDSSQVEQEYNQARQVALSSQTSKHEQKRKFIRKDFLLPSDEIRIFGSDISAEAISMAKENAKRANVLEYIDFSVKDINSITYQELTEKLGGDRILLVTNPPYGERLGDLKQAQLLMNKIRNISFTEGKLRKGIRLSILTPDDETESIMPKVADKRRKLYNGGIQCTLYHYFKFDH